MTSPQKLSFEQLLDWLEGRLAPVEAATIAAQVAQSDDPQLQAERAWVQAFLQLKETIVLEAPPVQVREQLRQQFAETIKPRTQTAAIPSESAPTPARGSFFQQLLGILTFDSQGQPGLAGARGGAQPTARQLIYDGTLAEIALNLHFDVHQQRFTLFGQHLPLDAQATGPVAIQLLHAGTEVAITTTDDLGEFSFTALPPGEYALVVSSAQGEINLAPLPLTL